MKKGFTLVELLVVIAILGILASVAFGQYRTSQEKARDAQRKGDLNSIAQALEMYYADNKSYPLASNGKITIELEDSTLEEIDWDSSFQKDINGQTIVYMKRLPRDPDSASSYCYAPTADYTGYALYSMLENENNNDYCASGYSCSTIIDYRYVVTSTNERIDCPSD